MALRTVRHAGAVLLPTDTPLPTTVGGFRLVRVVGHDHLATTALIHGDGETWTARVFHPSTDDAAMEAELAVHDALATGSAEVRQHVAALDDLITLPDGRLALVLRAATGPTLHDVLSARHGTLELGEAVTTLAPLVAAVEGAHDVGVTGLPLDPRGIRFAGGGAPVITSVTGATAGPLLPGRFRDHESTYGDDHRAVVRLLRSVAAATARPGGDALQPVIARARGDRPTVLALFDTARPIPVRLDEGGRTVVPAVAPPAGAGGEDRTDVEHGALRPAGPTTGPRSASFAALASSLSALGVPSPVTTTIIGAAESVSRGAESIRRAVRSSRRGLAAASSPPVSGARASRTPVRRSFLVAGVTGGLALVVAVGVTAIAPPRGDAHSAGPSHSPSAPPIATTAPVMGAELPERVLRPEADDWRPVIAELVRRWGQCRASVAVSGGMGARDCAFDVAHAGSAAEALLGDDDGPHTVLASWLSEGGDVVVTERMGAVALVDLIDPFSQTTAASLLVIRSEAGWRVRDVLD